MPRARSHKLVLSVMVAGMLALAIAGAIGALFDDPPIKTPTTTAVTVSTTTLVPISDFGPVGKAMGTLIESGRHVDYHATYEVTDPALPEGLRQTVEVWRKGELFRSDIVERAANGTHRTTSISGGAVARSCETVNGKQTCKVATTIPADLPAAFVRAVVTAKKRPTLVARDADVAGYVAKCFSAGDVGELCLAEDGVMLRVVLQGASIQAAEIVDEVPAVAFDTAG